MIKNEGYHKLKIVPVTKELIKIVYELTQNFPKNEQFGLTSQLRRASISILLNIVEGHRKKSDKEFYRFLETADCSNAELEVGLEISCDLGLLSTEQYKKVESKRQEVSFMLVKFMKTVQLSIQ